MPQCYLTRHITQRLAQTNQETTSRNRLLFLPLAGTFDESAQITNRQVQREVDGSQELHEEQIPAEQADDETQCTCGGKERRVGAVTEEECRQTAESRDQK